MTIYWSDKTKKYNKISIFNKQTGIGLTNSCSNINIVKTEKYNFLNIANSNTLLIKHKKIKIKNNHKKTLILLTKLFFNSIHTQFKITQSYLLQNIFFNFFINHDVHLFSKKICYYLMGCSKSQLMRFVRKFQLLNKKQYDDIFVMHDIKGFYVKLSGKFNGFGGAKKLKKHIIIKKIKFTDVNIKTHRSINHVQHKVGLTTMSMFVSFYV